MRLYHGTNIDIESIDLKAGLKYKDFGQGFYLTTDNETAERMARKKVKLFGGRPIVIVYEFDIDAARTECLSIKEFPKRANADWIQFIGENRDRKRQTVSHNYDIVIGPIADDGVALQLANYQNEILTPEEAAIRLQDNYLDQQYCFSSEKSLAFLIKIEVWQLD